jgi:hypothetical protein
MENAATDRRPAPNYEPRKKRQTVDEADFLPLLADTRFLLKLSLAGDGTAARALMRVTQPHGGVAPT